MCCIVCATMWQTLIKLCKSFGVYILTLSKLLLKVSFSQMVQTVKDALRVQMVHELAAQGS